MAVLGQDSGTYTPQDVERKRRWAEILLKGQQTAKEPFGALAMGLRGAMAGWNDYEAGQGEAAGRKTVADLLQGKDWQAAMASEWASPQQAALASALMGREWQQQDQAAQWAREDARAARAEALQRALASKPDWQTIESGGDVFRWNANDPNSTPSLFFDGPEAQANPVTINDQLVNPSTGQVIGDYRNAPTPPNPMSINNQLVDPTTGQVLGDYRDPPSAPTIAEMFDPATGLPVKQQWANGGWQDFGGVSAPDSPLVTVNTGETVDGELNKALSKGEGDQWATYKKAGTTAAGNNQDFQILDQLIDVAPQGPVVGPLAETFKGFSSAGDAFESIVKRIAPTLRVEGSGATSDIEYEGMLRSLPALRNSKDGNRMILEIMRAKSQINMARSEIISAYQGGDIDVKEARRQLNALDRQPLMSPDMKKALLGLGASEPDKLQAPEVGAMVDGYIYLGGDPASPTSWKRQ